MRVDRSPAAAAARGAGARRVPAWRALAPYLGSLAALLLFAGALWLLHHQVAAYRAADVRHALRALGWGQIAGALALAALSYAVLTLYDVLAFRHLKKRLPYGRIALGAFTSYAFTHSFGFGSLIHATIRYRLYVPLGLRVAQIAELTAFINVTFMIGLAILFPVVAVIDEPALEALGLPQETSLAFAAVALVLTGGYLVLGKLIRRPIAVFGFPLRVPGPGMALAQIVLSVADLALAGAVLYFCFPFVHRAEYPHVLAVFIVALTAGFISHVPGGLGVFDTIVLVGLQDSVPGDAILAGLVVFRVVYFLLPLLVAGVLFGVVEAMQARRRLARLSQGLAAWIAPGVPLVLAGCTFVAGAVLLFSNATPEAHYRLRLLYQVLPLSVVEASHFLGSVIGVLLVLVAARLQRRSHGAWLIALVLLAAGAAASLLKGLEWPQALLLLVLFLALLASRDEFYQHSALVAERFTPGWFLGVGVVLGSAFWLGLFSYKHLDHADELWWRFALYGDASRFVRASVAVAVIALAEAARRLLGTVRLHSALPTPRALAQAAEIVARSPDSRAKLALLGDKALLFHPAGDAFLMYGVRRRSWIALGDPVGPCERWRDLFAELAAQAARHGGWPMFYGISAAAARMCSHLGLAVRKIGEEAVVRLDGFGEDRLDPELRAELAPFGPGGFEFDVLDPVDVAPLAPRLKAVAEEWLAARGEKERAFAAGAFSPELLHDSRVAVVRAGERIVAFAVLWEAADGGELSVDLVRHTADAPACMLDFVLAETMLWASGRGYRAFNLGLAPLRGLDRRQTPSRWQRLGTYLYGHGEHYRDFCALRRAKERFRPRWAARFVSSRQGLPLARALPDLAQLIAAAPRAFAAR
jgi:phosphatidylglycerol lysyltransferase